MKTSITLTFLLSLMVSCVPKANNTDDSVAAGTEKLESGLESGKGEGVEDILEEFKAPRVQNDLIRVVSEGSEDVQNSGDKRESGPLPSDQVADIAVPEGFVHVKTFETTLGSPHASTINKHSQERRVNFSYDLLAQKLEVTNREFVELLNWGIENHHIGLYRSNGRFTLIPAQLEEIPSEYAAHLEVDLEREQVRVKPDSRGLILGKRYKLEGPRWQFHDFWWPANDDRGSGLAADAASLEDGPSKFSVSIEHYAKMVNHRLSEPTGVMRYKSAVIKNGKVYFLEDREMNPSGEKSNERHYIFSPPAARGYLYEYYFDHKTSLRFFVDQKDTLEGQDLGELPVRVPHSAAYLYAYTYNLKQGIEPLGEQHYRRFSGYRLPTNAEWEFLARAGSEGELYQVQGQDVDRSEIAHLYPNFNRDGLNRKIPFPGGQKLPNDFGLYDMIGNVQERVLEYYTALDEVDPYDVILDPYPSERGNPDGSVTRGGQAASPMRRSLQLDPLGVAELSRSGEHHGFRLVRAVPKN